MGVGLHMSLAGWPGPRPCQEARLALELARAGEDALLMMPSYRARSSGLKGMSSIKGPASHPETHKSSHHLSSPSHLQFQPGPAVAAGCSRSAGTFSGRCWEPATSPPGAESSWQGHSRHRPSQARIPHCCSGRLRQPIHPEPTSSHSWEQLGGGPGHTFLPDTLRLSLSPRCRPGPHLAS